MDARLIETAQAAPFCCGICTNDSGPFVDTGATRESVAGHLDAMYVCVRCVGELATFVGWITPESAEEMRVELAALRDEHETLSVENELMKDPRNRLVRASEVLELAEQLRPASVPERPAFGAAIPDGED